MIAIEVDLYGINYWFIVDTGANGNIIRDTVAKKLHDKIWIPDTEDGFIITGIAKEKTRVEESVLTLKVANINEATTCNSLSKMSILCRL